MISVRSAKRGNGVQNLNHGVNKNGQSGGKNDDGLERGGQVLKIFPNCTNRLRLKSPRPRGSFSASMEAKEAKRRKGANEETGGVESRLTPVRGRTRRDPLANYYGRDRLPTRNKDRQKATCSNTVWEDVDIVEREKKTGSP